MDTLKDNAIMAEIVCGNNFEYVLNKAEYFVSTDYKVLQSQTNGTFVQCMKMVRNGNPSLFYLIDECKPMSEIFKGITSDIFITLIVNLFASVIEVRSNGFLACQNIDISWDKIYVEPNTLKVKLVYLPLSVKAFGSYAEFESELRSGTIKLADRVVAEQTDKLKQFITDLCNGSLSLEDVYNKSKGTGNSPAMRQNQGAPIKLVAMNAPSYFELIIDQNDLTIGKKLELVDKAITFNNMISRKHCRITCVSGLYYINDEGSANGTFVNGVKLNPGQKMQINHGDIIRLANSDFQIV